jgi:hypothetical protein
MNFNNYIDDLLRHGKCSFTIQQAQHSLEKSLKAIYSSIEHLLTKNELANPALNAGDYSIAIAGDFSIV